MKRPKLSIIVLFILIAIALCVGVILTANTYLSSTDPKNPCPTHGATYNVIAKNGAFTPQHTEARFCDELTITNLDQQQRLIAFGPHENHVAYDGVSERLLAQRQSLTLTLVQSGSFLFHDHLDDSVIGSFTVSK
jgi:hypothetical protein